MSSRVTNWPLWWLMDVLAAALVLMIASLTLTSIRVTVGSATVTVHCGLLGLPRFRYRSRTISRAEVTDRGFGQLDGLGLRWSPWRGTRLTVRSGPVLVLHREARGAVTISCADPGPAEALIDGV
jgi:hypothetical protein